MIPDLTEAKLAGRDAGRLELAAGLNPYEAGSLEALSWETERIQTIATRTLGIAQRQDKRLDALLERARHHVMTPKEIYEQRASWIHGELGLDGIDVSENQVKEALARLGIVDPAKP